MRIAWLAFGLGSQRNGSELSRSRVGVGAGSELGRSRVGVGSELELGRSWVGVGGILFSSF